MPPRQVQGSDQIWGEGSNEIKGSERNRMLFWATSTGIHVYRTIASISTNIVVLLYSLGRRVTLPWVGCKGYEFHFPISKRITIPSVAEWRVRVKSPTEAIGTKAGSGLCQQWRRCIAIKWAKCRPFIHKQNATDSYWNCNITHHFCPNNSRLYIHWSIIINQQSTRLLTDWGKGEIIAFMSGRQLRWAGLPSE